MSKLDSSFNKCWRSTLELRQVDASRLAWLPMARGHAARSAMMSNGRIAFFARNTVAHPNPGGMETSFASMARLLANEGYTLALVTTVGFAETDEFAKLFDQVWVLPRTRVGSYSREWWRATRGRGGWEDWRPDVVIGIGDAGGGYASRPSSRNTVFVTHCHGTPLMEAASALSAGGAMSIPRAALNIARLPSRSRYYRASSVVWAVSERVAASVAGIARGGPPIRILPNAIDPDRYEPSIELRSAVRSELGLPAAARVGLYLGRLDRQKGIDIAIKAMAKGGSPDFLLIAGKGTFEGTTRTLVARSDLTGRVLMLGHVMPSKVRELLTASDVLLLPTRRREGLPMVILEAAASGLAVVASRTAAIPADLAQSRLVRVIRRPSVNCVVSALGSLGTQMTDERKPYLPDRYVQEFSAKLQSDLIAELIDREGP